MEPVTLVVGALLLVLGYLAGRVHRRSVKNTPTCTCKHTLAYHDPTTGVCHGQTLHKDARSEHGAWLGNQWVPCTCRQYDGPRPIEQYLASQIMPPQEG